MGFFRAVGRKGTRGCTPRERGFRDEVLFYFFSSPLTPVVTLFQMFCRIAFMPDLKLSSEENSVQLTKLAPSDFALPVGF